MRIDFRNYLNTEQLQLSIFGTINPEFSLFSWTYLILSLVDSLIGDGY